MKQTASSIMVIIIATVCIIALVEAVCAQEPLTLDLTTTEGAAQLQGAQTRTFAQVPDKPLAGGTRIDQSSGVVWLPWTLNIGERIAIDVTVGYGHREGIAVSDNRIVANRHTDWLDLYDRTTIHIGASGIVEDGSVVATYQPGEAASVGLWINSTNGYTSALKVTSATYYPAMHTLTPTFPPVISTPTPVVTLVSPEVTLVSPEVTPTPTIASNTFPFPEGPPEHEHWITEGGYLHNYRRWRIEP